MQTLHSYLSCNDRLTTTLRSCHLDVYLSCGSDDIIPPTQPFGKQERNRLSRCHRLSTASLSSSGVGAGEAPADKCEAQDIVTERPLPSLPPPSLYRTLRRCRPCAQCDEPDDGGDAFASFDTGREAILPVGCTSTQTFTSNCTTTTSTKKTTTSSINQSRKTTSNTTDHHHHCSPAWHVDYTR